jgi:DNA-binding Xre family transcriptional regulator
MLRLNLGAQRGMAVTLQEVADAANIERAALNRIELGKTRGIDFETLEKLCAYYGVGVGDILEYDPNIQKPGHAASSLATA